MAQLDITGGPDCKTFLAALGNVSPEVAFDTPHGKRITLINAVQREDGSGHRFIFWSKTAPQTNPRGDGFYDCKAEKGFFRY